MPLQHLIVLVRRIVSIAPGSDPFVNRKRKCNVTASTTYKVDQVHCYKLTQVAHLVLNAVLKLPQATRFDLFNNNQYSTYKSRGLGQPSQSQWLSFQKAKATSGSQPTENRGLQAEPGLIFSNVTKWGLNQLRISRT